METNWKEILALVMNVTVLRFLWPAIYILVNKEPGSQWRWGKPPKETCSRIAHSKRYKVNIHTDGILLNTHLNQRSSCWWRLKGARLNSCEICTIHFLKDCRWRTVAASLAHDLYPQYPRLIQPNVSKKILWIFAETTESTRACACTMLIFNGSWTNTSSINT